MRWPSAFFPVCCGVAALCSAAYELMLAECLSILFGQTVVRYSVTIGLYLFALGIGALLQGLLPCQDRLRRILKVEVALALLGSAVPALVFGATHLFGKVSLLAGGSVGYGVILAIGVLSGIEVALFLELARTSGGRAAAQVTLAADYGGTFLGALAFPCFLYTGFGIVAGAGVCGALNGVVGLALCAAHRVRSFSFVAMSALAVAMGLISIVWDQQIITILATLLFRG